MLNGKRTRKAIAVLLLVIFTTEIFFPTAAYALTSGPTAPEATSFEPVDTTDMVNLQTGDLTYTIPLLEVPGPEGGYPLSLSYHAAIQPNEDASWVGLGWTLNPGAVTRTVSGYPDDWAQPTNTSHTYWSGTTTTTYNIGVNIGIANSAASVSFGLSFSQDTYRGFGIGVSAGFTVPIGGKDSPFSFGLDFGVDGYGDSYASATFRYELIKDVLSTSVGFKSDNHGNLSGRAGVSTPALGVSMNTSSSKPKLSVVGSTTWVSSTEQAGIQSSSSGFELSIPTSPVGFSLGYSKDRYWIDKTTGVTAKGTLFGSGSGTDGTGKQVDNIAFDNYALLEAPLYKNIIDYPDPTKVQGGAYPDFDIYTVNAQGLGGNMRPYLLQGEMLGQNRKNDSGNPLVTYYSPGVTDPQPQFRFIGDFSNSYRQNYPDYATPNSNLRFVQPPFDVSPVYGNGDGSFGYADNKLAGSRHIDMGVQIQPSNAAGYIKLQRYKSGMIDGFSITNESGVTYHYGLPAYSWGEENYQEKISRATGLYFNRGTKTEAYAYTWYLTSITGPDFVDRNSDGKAGSGDWGYWVNFEYGKWSDNYVWRNPSEGFLRDEDNEFQNCAIGKKEVYYLNAIRTRTHVALFEKDLRKDGKASSATSFNKNVNGSTSTDYANAGVFDNTSAQSLQLSKIYIIDAANTNYVNNTTGSGAFPSPVSCTDCQLAGNVLDKTDIEASGRAGLEAISLRIIDLTYDYSSCANTTNSYDINTPSAKDGKLTLKQVASRGKKGFALLPPVKFDYDLTGTDLVTQNNVSLSTGNFTTTSGNFEIGNLILKDGAPAVYCGVITSKIFSAGTYTYTLANSNYVGGTISANVRTTKNPPYNKDMFDIWGMYKSDYNSAQTINNENLGRMTTDISAKSTDVWSLRKITSPIGTEVKINYESDEYSKSVLTDEYSLVGADAQKVVGNNNQLRIDIAGLNIPLSNFYQVNDQANFIMDVRSVSPNAVVGAFCAWVDLVFTHELFDTKTSVNSTIIKEVGSNYLVVENPDFAGFFQSPVPVKYVDGSSITTTCIKNKVPNACNLKVMNRLTLPGGGLRVKKITLTGINDNFSSSIVYNYSAVQTPLVSSGVTSYEPWVLSNVNIMHPHPADVDGPKFYKSKLYKNVNSLLAMSREILPPGVMYEYVTVSSEVKNSDEANARQLEGKMQYQFEVFRQNMIDRQDIGTRADNTNAFGRFITHNVALKKYTSSVGRVKSIIQFDKDGKIIKETVNHYLHDGLDKLSFTDYMTEYKARLATYFYQGYLQERYSEVKEVSNQPNSSDNGVMATLSSREEYPCILTGQTVINYVNSTFASTYNLGFDFYSGAVTKTLETDAYGNRFMTEITPAYRKYPNLGLKLSPYNTVNKNMLVQEAARYVYKVDASNNKLGLVTANIQTWNDANGGIVSLDENGNTQSQYNLYRKQATYMWMPETKTTDGITAYGSFVDFNWGTPSSSDTRWKKTGEATLYDVYSNALEAKDMTGNYAATRMDYGNKKVVLTGGPANYYEIAYSGAEDDGINQASNVFVKKGSGVVASGVYHTGKKSLKLGTGGQTGFLYSVSTDKLTPNRNYILSVWVKPVTGSASDVKLYYQVNSVTRNSISSGSSTKTAGGWQLINLIVNASDIVPATTLQVGCRNDHGSVAAYVDDIRFQPLNAITTSYVYDDFTGDLTYKLDNSNLYTRYEYDYSGRVSKVYKEKLTVGEFKTNEYQYNLSAANKFYNIAVNKFYVKNDCPNGEAALGNVTINIPVNTFTSYLSQDDVDRQTENYAQSEANRLGTCSGAPCTVPVVNSISYGSTTTVNVNFTPPAGAFTILVYYYDYTTGITNSSAGSTTSPRSVTLPAKGRAYKIWVVSYGPNCSNIYSNTVDFYLPQ